MHSILLCIYLLRGVLMNNIDNKDNVLNNMENDKIVSISFTLDTRKIPNSLDI